MSDSSPSVESNATPPSAVTPEAVTTGTPAPPPVLTPAAQSNLQVLMNRERAVRTQESAVKAQAAEVQALREQIEAQKNPVEKDPTTVNGEEIETLRSQLADMQTREEDYRNKTVIAEERSRFRSELSAGDGNDAIKAVEAYDTVFDHVVDHFNKTGEYLSHAQAAETVNTQLLDLARKLAPLMAAAPPAPSSQDDALLEAAQTLSNGMTSEAGTKTSPNLMSDAEVMAKAVEMLQYTQ